MYFGLVLLALITGIEYSETVVPNVQQGGTVANYFDTWKMVGPSFGGVPIFIPIENFTSSRKSDQTTTEDGLVCGRTLFTLGDRRCVEEWSRSGNQGGFGETFEDYNRNECPLYGKIGCSPEAGNFTTNPDLLFDQEVDDEIFWIASTNEITYVTVQFSRKYVVTAIWLVVRTIPLKIDLEVLEGDQWKTIHIAQADVEMCSGESCEAYYTVAGNILEVYPKRTTDSLRIVFPAVDTFMDYKVDYILLQEIFIGGSCYCGSEERGTETVPDGDYQYLATSCECECKPQYRGLECMQCNDDSYKVSNDCIWCECGYGSVNQSCDSAGTCVCNEALSIKTELTGPKCNVSYVDSVSPLSYFSQTLITIEGGLLTQLNINESVCSTTCDGCVSSDTVYKCRTSSLYEEETIMLFTGKFSNGTDADVYLTRVEPVITEISPHSGHESGGRMITIGGHNLDFINNPQLEYLLKCDGRNNLRLTTACDVIDSMEMRCFSLVFKSVLPNCTNPTVQVKVPDDSGKLSSPVFPFNVIKDPEIEQFEDFEKKILSGDKSFVIDGKFPPELNATEYEVTISPKGLNKTLLLTLKQVTENQITVELNQNNSREGTVKVSVGGWSETVGLLFIDSNLSLILGLSIGLGLLFIIILIVVLVICLKRIKKKQQTKQAEFTEHVRNVRYVQSSDGRLSILKNCQVSKFIDQQLLNEIKPHLIPKRSLILGNVLGSGQFGKVFKAQIQLDSETFLPVAAKTIKALDTENLDIGSLNAFIKEAVTMIPFHHANVLHLIGVVNEDDCMPIVVLPYMSNGDLKHVLTSERSMTLSDMLHMALQVARGMEYLASLRFVHRDLAARNCMVDDGFIVKVADFGLSRDIYQSDYYQMGENPQPLPVKWMSVESLLSGRFTVESDVWSYGVVMWEMFTRGTTPYPHVLNPDIKTYLQEGGRLTKPEYCPALVYDLMVECWRTDLKSRITFSKLVKTLSEFLTEHEPEPDSLTAAIQEDYYLKPNPELPTELYIDVLE